MKKQCQVCKIEIPEDFVNLLCVKCYKREEKEIEQKKADEVEDREKMGLNGSIEPQPVKDEKTPKTPPENKCKECPECFK